MKKNVILLLIAVILLVTGIGAFIFSTMVIQEVQSIPADATVQQEVLGLNANKDALHFGLLKPGTGGKREVIISSKQRSWVTVKMGGEMAPWMFIQNSSLMIERGEFKKLEVSAWVPEGTPTGNYTGEVKFIFHEPWIRYLEMFK